MPTLMPHPLAYVFKQELIYVPFFGWAMGRMDMIHIDRSQRAQAFNKVVEQGKRLLAQGIWVIMFPEGTRIPRGQKGTYKSGGTRLAMETGAPVIPIAVTSAKVWPRKAFIKRPGIVDVSIGKPIPSEGRQPDELMREVEAWIEAEMRRLDPEAYTIRSPRADRSSCNSRAMRRLLQLTLDSRPMQSPFQLLLDLFDEPKPPASAGAARRHRRGRLAVSPAGRAAGPGPAARSLPPSATPTARRCWASAGGLRIPPRQAPQHRLHGRPRGPDGQRAHAGCRCTRSTPRCTSKAPLDRRASWATRASGSERARVGAHRVEGRRHLPLPGRAGDRGAGSAPCLRRGRRACSTPMARPCPACRAMTLHVGLPQTAQPAQIRDAVQAWLMRQAKRAVHRAARPLRAAAGRAMAQAGAEQRRHALGHRALRRPDPPELAAGPLPPAGDRLRGGARTEPPARDGPQPALLGDGAHGGARLRRSCAAS